MLMHGGFVLLLCHALMCSYSCVNFFFARKKTPNIKKEMVLEWLRFFAIFFAVVSLAYSAINDNFRLAIVYKNSSTLLPWWYKIASIWGSNEGSLLLWIMLLNFVALIFPKIILLEKNISLMAMRINCVVLLLFDLFVLLLASPFDCLPLLPSQGLGLTPVLQDSFMLIHPPKLYLGYVATAMLFSSLVSILINRAVTVENIALIKKWILINWTVLTIGIGLGSAWAYKELGWGGFWAWDPVENASLLPWLMLSAMLHFGIKKNLHNNLKTIILLGILVFVTVLTGTTIVRSGYVQSVHSFAIDSLSAVGMAAITLIVAIFGLTAYWRWSGMIVTTKPSIFSWKDRAIALSPWLFMVIFFAILVGIVSPYLFGFAVGGGEEISGISLQYYNVVCGFLSFILMVLCFFAVSGSWARMVAEWFCGAGLCGLLTYCFDLQFNLIETGMIFAACSLSISQLVAFFTVQKNSFHSIIAHLGVGIFMIGVVFSSCASKNTDLLMDLKETVKFASFDCNFKELNYLTGSNYLSREVVLSIGKNDQKIGFLRPELRFYPAENIFSAESSKITLIFSDIYAVAGAIKNGKAEVHLHYKPLIGFVWLGFVVMALGGLYGIIEKSRKNIIVKKV